MSKSLKIEVLVEDIISSGVTDSLFVSKQQYDNDYSLVPKLDSNGKINIALLPDELSSLLDTLNDQLVTITRSVSEAISTANQYTDNKLSKKADLNATTGKIRQSQLPLIEEYSGFQDYIQLNIYQKYDTEIESINSRLDTLPNFSRKADLDSEGKVVQSQLPDLTSYPSYASTIQNLQDFIQLNIEDLKTAQDQINSDINGLLIAIQSIFDSPTAGDVLLPNGQLVPNLSKRIGGMDSDISKLKIKTNFKNGGQIEPAGSWGVISKIQDGNAAEIPELNAQAKVLLQMLNDIRKNGGVMSFDQNFANVIGGFDIGDRVKLDTGEVVVSTIVDNKTNPNSNMTGWINSELEFYVQNAGAKADFNSTTETGTDNLQAFKDARDYVVSKGGGVVRIPAGNYLLKLNGDGVSLNNVQNVKFVGDGKHTTILWIDPTNIEDSLFYFVGGSGWLTGRGLSGVTIKPIPSKPLQGIAVKRNGACFTIVNDFIFSNLYVGDDYINGTGAGTFTEFNLIKDGQLFKNKINRRYKVDGGDNSFHGNDVINVKNQVLENGGIGVQLKGSSTTPAYLYNQMWLEHYFGGSGCIAISIDRANTDNLWGNLTHEDALIIESKSDYAKFHFNGNFNGIGSITYNIFNENSKGFGVVVFNNTNSLRGNFTNSNLSSYAPGLLQLGQQDKNYNGVGATIYRIGDGLGLNCYWQSAGFNFTRSDGPNNILGVTPSFNISANGQTLKSFNSNYNIVNINNNGLQIFDDRIQGVSAGMNLGRYDKRFGALLLTGLDISYTSFTPHVSGICNIGGSSNYVKDIFSQNAVTVVSDKNHKTEISELTEQELQCAVACGKLYRKYKLNVAVDEKGVNAARYHIGVIAQEVVQCFTDHGLDWHKYGIITYEKWNAIEAVEYQAAIYDENGQELTPEIQAVEAKEAGEIYMVRYNELDCFINAGLEYRLSQLE